MNNHLFVSTIFLVLVFLTIYLVHVTFYLKEKKKLMEYKLSLPEIERVHV